MKTAKQQCSDALRMVLLVHTGRKVQFADELLGEVSSRYLRGTLKRCAAWTTGEERA